MLQHVLSDAVIPECGVFPLKHPHAHNFLYSVYNFKFFKEESLMILLRVGWNAACRTVCACCVKAGPMEVFGRGVWEKAKFLETFNESSNFHSPYLLRCSTFSCVFELWFSQAFCITDDPFLQHGVLLPGGILWLPCPPSFLSPPLSSHLPEICWDLSNSNALPPFLLLPK